MSDERFDETLWVVLRFWNNAVIPIAWRFTEEDASLARNGFAKAWDKEMFGDAWFVSMAITNGESDCMDAFLPPTHPRDT